MRASFRALSAAMAKSAAHASLAPDAEITESTVLAPSGWLNVCAAERLPDHWQASSSASALLAKCAEHFGAVRGLREMAARDETCRGRI